MENLTDGEEVGYELLLIKGTVDGGARSVRATLDGESRDWPAAGGHYKVLVDLHEGVNRIQLEAAGQASREVEIKYSPKTRGDYVRVVYVVASDGDGRYQAPSGSDGDSESARKRLRFGALLMQTATAELMHEAGYGRETFRLMRDVSGEVETLVYRSRLSMERSHEMTGLAIWRDLYEELNGASKRYRNLAIIGMTRYDKQEGKARAHTALGGGGLALMGSGNLHTWASGLDDLVECFSDTRRVDDFGLFDDSAYRKTFWANYATGLGACLHELGHSFGLSHSGDNKGIMERGFDHINRLFMVTEGGRVFEDEDIRWTAKSAGELNSSGWLN